MNSDKKRLSNALEKELRIAEKAEKRMERSASKARPPEWKTMLESKIPEKVYSGPESAFCKGFAIVFTQGSAIIEKGCSKENAKADFAIRDYAVQVKADGVN